MEHGLVELTVTIFLKSLGYHFCGSQKVTSQELDQALTENLKCHFVLVTDVGMEITDNQTGTRIEDQKYCFGVVNIDRPSDTTSS